MWTLVHSPKHGYGVLQIVGDTTPYVLRAYSDRGPFFVNSISLLSFVAPDISSEPYSEWLATVDRVVLDQFTSDDPLQYLKDHYPEHYL